MHAWGRGGGDGLRARALPLWLTDAYTAPLALVVLAGALFAVRVIHGGFYADDWQLASLYRFPTHAGRLHDFFATEQGRPLQALWFLFVEALIGLHARAQLILSIALAVAASSLFYALLRRFAFTRIEAWLLAALVLAFPAADATKLWANANSPMLAATFCLAGLLLSESAFRAHRRPAIALHCASCLCYVGSVLVYELAAPVMVLSAVLLGASAPRRARFLRAGVDLAVLALILATVTSQTRKAASFGPSTLLDRARTIAEQGVTVICQALVPAKIGEHRLLVLPVIAVIVAGGVLVYRRITDAPQRQALLRAGMTAAVGLVVTDAGWLMLLPASAGYLPAAGGDVTRVNTVAAFGLVLMVVAVVQIAVAIPQQFLNWSSRSATFASCVVIVAIGCGYAVGVIRDSMRWNTAVAQAGGVLNGLHASFPTLPSGAVVYATGFDEMPYQNTGTFKDSWSLNGAVRILYSNGSITTQPVVTGRALRCDSSSVSAAVGPFDLPWPATRYSAKTYLWDAGTRQRLTLSSRAACLAAGGVVD